MSASSSNNANQSPSQGLKEHKKIPKPSSAQMNYLRLGLDQPGGKLPLFDKQGQKIKGSTIQSCIGNGWAEPWFSNPLKPDWLVCKLTPSGFEITRR